MLYKTLQNATIIDIMMILCILCPNYDFNLIKSNENVRKIVQ